MKKIVSLMLCAVLLCCAAFASGFDGLTSIMNTVPDPGPLLLSIGSLLQTDYQFADDLLCDVYVYHMPYDENGWPLFLNAYAEELYLVGYDCETTTVDDVKVYRIEKPGSDIYSLLIPDFEGKIVFLVNVDMPFAGRDAAD